MINTRPNELDIVYSETREQDPLVLIDNCVYRNRYIWVAAKDNGHAERHLEPKKHKLSESIKMSKKKIGEYF